jgi:hypothetical protein
MIIVRTLLGLGKNVTDPKSTESVHLKVHLAFRTYLLHYIFTLIIIKAFCLPYLPHSLLKKASSTSPGLPKRVESPQCRAGRMPCLYYASQKLKNYLFH